MQNLEKLATVAYTTLNSGERKDAEASLQNYFPGSLSSLNPSEIKDIFERCKTSLISSRNDYFLLNVTSYLKTIFQKHAFEVPVEVRRSVRLFVLEYLFNVADCKEVILKNLCDIHAVLCKIDWFEVKDTFKDIQNTFIKSNDVRLVKTGISILVVLVNEMGKIEPLKSTGVYRKICSSVRDTQLLDLFKIGLLGLKQQSSDQQLIKQWLSLLVSCLSFDFIGSNIDESSEEGGIIQLPMQWRSEIENEDNINTILDCLNLNLQSKTVLELLVLLVSIRRSIFSSSDSKRNRFLENILTKFIQFIPSKINDLETFHEVCKFVAKLKIVYQISDLVEISCFKNEFMNLVCELSAYGFKNIETCMNSVNYLLVFWNKLMSSVLHNKLDSYAVFEEMAAKVSVDIINTLLATKSDEVMEDLLFSSQEETIINLAENIASICRGKYYAKVIQHLLSLFDGLNPLRLSVLIFLVASFIGNKNAYTVVSMEAEAEELEATLVMKIIIFMNNFNQSVSNNLFEIMVSSFIEFLTRFKVNYVIDASSRYTNHVLLLKLKESLNLNDSTDIMEFVMMKSIAILKEASQTQRVQLLKKGVSFLAELTSGYSSVKVMASCDSVKMLLLNHNLLIINQTNDSVYNIRSLYYECVGKLLFAGTQSNGGADESVTVDFNEFMKPFSVILIEVQSIQSVNEFMQQKYRLVGLFKDLTGFMKSVLISRNYMFFFNFFFPAYFPVIEKTFQAFWNNPSDNYAIINCCLKFLAEFTSNQNQRMDFDQYTVRNAVLLFQQISNVLQYASIKLVEVSKTDLDSKLYEVKIKPLLLLLRISSNILGGKYVPFGVLQLFDEKSLLNCFGSFVQLVIEKVISPEEIASFPKLFRGVFVLLDLICKDHLHYLDNVVSQPEFYGFLFSIFHKTFTVVNTAELALVTDMCSSLDHLVTFLYMNLKENSLHHNGNTLSYFKRNPLIFQNLTDILLQLALTEDCVWTISRPLLVLFLLNKEYVAIGLNQKHGPLDINILLEGIEMDKIHSKNKDKFSSNLNSFKRDIQSILQKSSSLSNMTLDKNGKSVSMPNM